MLECGWCVRQPKGHNFVLEQPVATAEGSLPFITRGDPNEVVGASEVEFGEELGSGQPVKGFRDEWKRVPILDGDSVETAVVDAEAKRFVLLLDEKDGSSGR